MASDPGKFSCEICSENLRSKTGACVATVSLFSETSNKEFSNACNGKPVIFAELLRVLGIVLVQDRQDPPPPPFPFSHLLSPSPLGRPDSQAKLDI